MASSVATPIASDPRQPTCSTILAVRPAGARQPAEAKAHKPTNSFFTALLRALSVFVA